MGKIGICFFVVLLTLFSCEGTVCIEEPVLPEPEPAVLEVVSAEFVQEEGDATLPERQPEQIMATVQNPTYTTITEKCSWTELWNESSQFVLTSGALPEDADVQELTVVVPRLDSRGTVFRGTEVYPLSFDGPTVRRKERTDTQNVQVAPFSTYRITSQRSGFRVTMTCYLRVENKNTGEQYNLEGKWIGVQMTLPSLTLTDITPGKEEAGTE